MSSTATTLQVVNAGLYATVQDKGRFGLRHLGIPWSGVLCPTWQILANALLDIPDNSPVIECFENGLKLRADNGAIRIAVVGCKTAVLHVTNDEQKRIYQPNRSFTLAIGETLHLVSTGNSKVAVIAVDSLDIPLHLGSTSTYPKAVLGGLNGKTLAAGDSININTSGDSRGRVISDKQCQLPVQFTYQTQELRVIAGPQHGHFSDAGITAFISEEFTLTAESDRMGVRLNGPKIEHLDAASKDIISDAIVPGSIQVPGSGQPIVLLNDSHTAGGYPKVATVISSDLPLLAVQRAHSVFRFRLITIDEAIEIRQHEALLIKSAIESMSICVRHKLDTSTLLKSNLIDGVTDGSEER